MTYDKRLLVPVMLIFMSFLGVSAANAQTPACPYTLASLQGTYATLATYGDNLGVALGLRIADGNGNETRSFLNNQPTAGSTTGQRTILTGTQIATYTVNCDGSGVSARMVTLADGTTSTGVDDFLITRSIERDGKLIATEIQDVQRVPSTIVPGGIFVTRIFTLRPSAQTTCYTLESLQGSYGVANRYGANVALGLQAESLDGRGNLTRTGILNQPTAGSTTGQRTVGTVTSTGSYTVNCNGTGAITRIVTRPDGTTASAADDFLITQAIEKDGRLVATTIVDAQRDPSVILTGGIFLSRTHTLRVNSGADTTQLQAQLQSLTCSTNPPTPSCQATVSVWNYYLVNNINPAAPVLAIGDGTQLMTVQRYLEARAAAGL